MPRAAASTRQGALRIARLRADRNRARVVGERCTPRRLIAFEGVEHLNGARRAARCPDAERAFHDARNGRPRPDATRTDQHHVPDASNPLIAEFSRRGRTRHTVQAIAAIRSATCSEPEEQPTCVVCAGSTLHGQEQRACALCSASLHPRTSPLPGSRRISGAPVLPYFPERRTDNRGYVVRIHPPFDELSVRRPGRRYCAASTN